MHIFNKINKKMITKEEILTRLMEERDKISKEKQITDKWIQVRADKLFEGVTEETDIEELIKFTVEVMPEMQANMNSIFKLESEKIKEDLAKKNKLKETKEVKEEKETETKFELPQEYKDALDFAKQFRAEKLVSEKKKEAFEIAKKGIGENQLPLLQLTFNKLNVSSDFETEAIVEMGLKDFNDILQLGITPSNIDSPQNTKDNINKNIDTYKEVKANILRKQ